MNFSFLKHYEGTFYLAIIFSDYQELNLQRFIDHSNIKNEMIVINGRFDNSRFISRSLSIKNGTFELERFMRLKRYEPNEE